MTKYDQEFKDEAVAIALSSGRPLTEIASDLGVNYKTFGSWVRQAVVSKNKSSNKQLTTKQGYQQLEKELRAAKNELSLRKQEIELLKKAAAYFAKAHK